MLTNDIRETLFQLRDEAYTLFQKPLIPTVPAEAFIGVRTPALRAYAKELLKTTDVTPFLNDLPHSYFDENQLHAMLLCQMRDFDACVDAVDRFLPYIDNWSTCDQLSPAVFCKNRARLLPKIREWLASEKPYTIRFGIGMLMNHFLDSPSSEQDEGAFCVDYAELVASLRSDEYYVNMMIAWYFATALAKQYEAVLPFIEDHRLAPWTHNKAIQKARESFRVPPERKAYLNTLKRPL